jgi:Arc/MetJ-type ribon-helix-helix transcriptional regulator
MALTNEPVTNVSIPNDLYEQIASAIKDKGFETVDDYITYVLRISIGKSREYFDPEDQEKVTSRLKALGYM